MTTQEVATLTSSGAAATLQKDVAARFRPSLTPQQPGSDRGIVCTGHSLIASLGWQL